ncbi:hypothetical protein [Halalkalibacter sp. APA_J-10(15)]|uniref:hypothetical protein n=1 Tax=Halalkalibacter sp. APA_J-10(15) TaxID=2933805 RepID=UPI001FF36BAC|nr:hypothetical protein [Halalkalibacter sp. APA_J-10(15)]MCK0471405.1 hypothetical protein [Halalkalibacter sp. APA_J-10(15)]
MEVIKSLEHICNSCGAKLVVPEEKCKDGMRCPACNGHFVFTGKVETISFHGDGERLGHQTPLLVIELENETAVPKVIYKGKEITKKANLFFDWETKTGDHSDGGLTYAIEYLEDDKEYPVVNRIERRVDGHAFD